MSTQPPSRTRFYRDNRQRKGDGRLRRHRRLYRHGRQPGPDHDGRGHPAWQRLPHPDLLHRRLDDADDKPRELVTGDAEEQRFWQGVRASPTQTARNIRSRMREIDRRLADIESYVTTENRTLAREIEQLR